MKTALIAATLFIATASLPLTATAAAKPAGGNNTQQVIQQLQAQIKQVQDSIAPAIKAQADATQKQITQLQAQTQAQFKNVQKQMEQLQTNLINQMKQLNAALTSGGSTPAPAKKKK